MKNEPLNEKELILKVNGKEHAIFAKPESTLLKVLRENLKLMGAREGCGIGMCGTCTVLVDGQPISSCLIPVAHAVGKEVVTIEGIAPDGVLHPVQQAYIDHAGFQCAYCTPGFVLSTVALLEEYPSPTDDKIREYLAGNLCRCGSYENILDSVRNSIPDTKKE